MSDDFDTLLRTDNGTARSEPDTAVPMESEPAVQNGNTGQDGDPPTAAGPAAKKGIWLLPTAAIMGALLGIACFALALLGPLWFPSDETIPERTAPEIETRADAIPAVDDDVQADRADTVGITKLADPAGVARIATSGGIPERAMAAYAGAAIWAAEEYPTCGLGWNTLAAIGHVESEHGTINGSSIGNDGVATPKIIGIPLDGSTTDAIPDTDDGRLDDDTEWDRAVGPMQFIPSTWAQYSRDGNGDGIPDINQIDDAAVSAAAYLCTVGGDLTQSENWIAAVGAYNASVDYNNRVADAATQYASLR